MAAEPVSPDVAPSTANRPSFDPVDKKYSKKLPSICNATSLNANVGPWNSSCVCVVCIVFLYYEVHMCCGQSMFEFAANCWPNISNYITHQDIMTINLNQRGNIINPERTTTSCNNILQYIPWYLIITNKLSNNFCGQI